MFCFSGQPGDTYGIPGAPGGKGLPGDPGFPGKTHQLGYGKTIHIVFYCCPLETNCEALS